MHLRTAIYMVLKWLRTYPNEIQLAKEFRVDISTVSRKVIWTFPLCVDLCFSFFRFCFCFGLFFLSLLCFPPIPRGFSFYHQIHTLLPFIIAALEELAALQPLVGVNLPTHYFHEYCGPLSGLTDCTSHYHCRRHPGQKFSYRVDKKGHFITGQVSYIYFNSFIMQHY